MNYHFYPLSDDVFYMIERHSHSKIAYYSKKRITRIYHDNGYEIIGEIGNSAKRYASQDIIITDTGRIIPVFPLGSLKKPFEWIAGYAAVGKNTYVSVVKSIIPRWLKNF